MEKNVNSVIGRNLSRLRKSKNLTQLELAKTFNFSDKTISKWENGESLPSLDVLMDVAEFYGVTLNDLVSPDLEVDEIDKRAKSDETSNKITVTLLSISIVWLIATICYVYTKVSGTSGNWTVFVWAFPVSMLVAVVFNGFWGNRKIAIWLMSLLLWMVLLSIFIEFFEHKIWAIFSLGIPSQIAIVLWSGIKPKNKKSNGNKSNKTQNQK